MFENKDHTSSMYLNIPEILCGINSQLKVKWGRACLVNYSIYYNTVFYVS